MFAQAGFTLDIPDLSSYDLMNAREKLKLEWEGGLCNTSNPKRDVLFKQAYYKRLKAVKKGLTRMAKPAFAHGCRSEL